MPQLKKPVPFERVAIIGTGLIGGSFGLALRKHFPVRCAIGFDRPDILSRALARGAIHEAGKDLSAAVRDNSDLVYIGTAHCHCRSKALPAMAAVPRNRAL